MKNILSVLFSAALFFTVFATTCCAAETNVSDFSVTLQIGNPNMTVNGTEKPIDDNKTTPVIVNDRTLLPIRAVIEEMGGTVKWNYSSHEVILTLKENEIKLTTNSDKAYLNGMPKKLDAAPIIINSRTMLPIRFIAESFAFGVLWDSETQKITITKNNPDVDDAH